MTKKIKTFAANNAKPILAGGFGVALGVVAVHAHLKLGTVSHMPQGLINHLIETGDTVSLTGPTHNILVKAVPNS